MSMVSDLSVHFPYDRILAVAGVSVKGSVPDITACPLCKKPTLTVYSDPLLSRSTWLRCGYCRFSGDTIETFQRISRTPNPAAAIREARRNGLCNATADKLSPLSIQAYTETCTEFRTKVIDIWEKLANGTLDDPSPELIHHAQSRGLWNGWLRNPHRQMTRFLGGGMRKVVNDLFLSKFKKQVLPKQGFGTVLATPWQDVPGRICGIEFMGIGSNITIPITPMEMDEPEGGLAMLDTLDGIEKTVYAVPSVDFALRYHKLNFINRNLPIKLIAYNDATNKAWDSVNTERLIFWSENVDWRLFRQAKRAKNGWISSEPNIRADNIDSYVRQHSPEMFLHSLDVAALPWPRFVALWLLDKRRTPQEIQGTLVSSGFNINEIELIIAECPERRRDDLKQLIREFTVKEPDHVLVGGADTVEINGSLYHRSKAGDSLITDAFVKVEYESTNEASNSVCWNGTILYKGEVRPFTDAPVRVIDKDPLKWLQDTMVKLGWGYPYFDKKWAKQFTNLIRRYSPNIRQMTVTNHLGLDKGNRTVVFPQFTLVAGAPMANLTSIPKEGTPAINVRLPRVRATSVPEPVTSARAAWFAAAAAYVSIVLEKLATPVYVIESPVTRSGISSFIESAGMSVVFSDTGDDEDKQRLLQLRSQFKYPTHLKVLGKALGELPDAALSSCFVSTNRLAALSMCTIKEGFMLRDAAAEDIEEMPPFDDVVWYLAHLQRNGFEFENKGNVVVSALRGLCQFLPTYLTQFDDANLALATNRVRVCARPGDCLLELMVLLCLSGKLGQEHVSLKAVQDGSSLVGPCHRGLGLDVENGCVFVSRQAVTRACRQAGLPRPDVFNAEKDLTERKLVIPSAVSDGFLISSGLWDEVIRACRRELNTPV